MERDEEITRNWVGTGRIDAADFAQLKAGYLASLGNPPNCTTCLAFEHDVQEHFQIKYRISKPDSIVNTKHLKFIVSGGFLMLPGADYGIVNEGVESANAKVLTNAMAEEILAKYPSYSTLIVANPDYDPKAEADRIEQDRLDAEARVQKQADDERLAQEASDRLADEQAVTSNLFKQTIPATGVVRTDETAGTSSTGTQQVAEGDSVRTDETAGTSSTGVESANQDEQPGALVTDATGQVSGQATAQTSEGTTAPEPLVNQMQLNLGDTGTGTAATESTPPSAETGIAATVNSVAEVEKKS